MIQFADNKEKEKGDVKTKDDSVEVVNDFVFGSEIKWKFKEEDKD